MAYNYPEIIAKVKKLVKIANDSPSNKYGPTVWRYHLELVARHALALGRKLRADLEVLELAAYLHDYAALLDPANDKKHHILGAELSEKILSGSGFPAEKTNKVKEAILRHRGSVPMRKNMPEAKILASADAMSHFYYVPDMFYLAYGVHKLKPDEGAAWLKAKLDRSWKKIIPEGRKMIREDRRLMDKILNQILKDNE